MQVEGSNPPATLLPPDKLLPETDEFNLHINADY